MKNKIIWIVLGLTLLVGAAAVTMAAVSSGGSSRGAFNDDGYILAVSGDYSSTGELSSASVGTTYVSGGAGYRLGYLDTVRFTDAGGASVSVDNATFIHYADKSVAAFANGVVMQLGDSGVVPAYYNVPAGALIDSTGSGYIMDNNGVPVSLRDFIFKISDDDYLFVSDTIQVALSAEETRIFENFIEVEYLDQGVVRITSPDGVWYTIAAVCTAKLANGAEANLAEQELNFGGAEPIGFASMVIDSPANETIGSGSSTGIIPRFEITTIDGEAGEAGDIGESGAEGAVGEAGTAGELGVAGEAGTAGALGVTGEDGTLGGDGAGGSGGATGGTGAAGNDGADGGTPSGGEGGNHDMTLPSMELSNWTVRASSISGTIAVVDDDAMLSADGVKLSVVDSSTGSVLASETFFEMLYDFNFSGLSPNGDYRLIAVANYDVSDTTYTREFINKVFRTDSIGLSLEKEYASTTGLGVRVTRSDSSSVSEVLVVLMYDDGTVRNTAPVTFTDGTAIINFSDLDPDTPYRIQLTDVVYDGSLRLETYGDRLTVSTLKRTPSLGDPLVVINQKNASFEVRLNALTDPDVDTPYGLNPKSP